MKAGRLIEQVMCCISTDDLEELTNMAPAPFKTHKNYEIFCILIGNEGDYCRVLLKEMGKLDR